LIRFGRPSGAEIAAILGAAPASFSYPEVGATAQLDRVPDHYDVDRHAFVVGTGREAFARASSALAGWRHFEIPWVELHHVGPVVSGQVVASVVGVPGCWLVNPCRVVYADFASDPDSVAYAYGTLRGHAECGEERFRVWLDPASNEVRYELSAFSRPAIFLSRIGYPLARRVQKRFARASADALIAAIRE
jgi:uncharacterized protein (UPF0548 family)